MKQEEISIKPLSVNEAWQGKRYKSPKYKAFEEELLLKLKPFNLPEPPYYVEYTFGVSSPLADWDNPIKPFQDILQKKYNFNDKDILEAKVNKILVKKGQEFISFTIENINDRFCPF